MKFVKILWRITKEAAEHKWLLITAGFFTLLMTSLTLAGPRIQTLIVAEMETGLTDESFRHLLMLTWLLLGIFILRAVFRFFANRIAHKGAWHIVESVRVKVYAKMQTFTADYFSKAQTGDLMSRVVNDTAMFEMLYAHILPEGASAILTFGGVMTILFIMNAKLALLTCIPIPIIIILSYTFMKYIRPYFRNAQNSLGGLNARLHDSFAGIQEVRAFGQEKRQEKKVREKAADYTYHILKSLFKASYFMPSIELLTAIGSVIVMGVGGYLAYRNQISISYVIGFLLYLTLFYAPITTMMNLLEQAQQAIAGAERVMEIIDTPVEIQTEEGAVELDGCDGAITFENVGFSYTSDAPVLKNISFDVKPGQFVALVGPTGVGKTTLVKLAARLYDPVSGAVRLDGHDLRDITLESLRKCIAYVPQDTFLFNATIAENIAFARSDATQADVIKAAQIARIHEDILSMPDGYDTVTGERGVKLSGGQKQRIAIARAVICGAPVLILDEATSSVDAQTERMIQRSIDELAGHNTIIAIAHRLSTIRNADLILVIRDGEIVERGTHDTLMALGGLYQHTYSLQSTETQTMDLF